MNTPKAIKNIFLHPGECYFGDGRTRISTLLGSCVSITLWHPRKRIGGMCHYLLAERKRSVNQVLDGRFGSEAFKLLMQHIKAAGTRPNEYQAKLFGGGNMIGIRQIGGMEIGSRNVEYGRQLLATLRIEPVAEHVGGSGRRKLHFNLWNGDVWLAFPQGGDACIKGDYG